jgi:predicted O-methyltransferase YrrM
MTDTKYTLRYKLAWRLQRYHRLGRLLLAGPYLRTSKLADLIVRNQDYPAIQIPSELAALGKILREHRPKFALEIGTASGGTLLFLTRLASPRATIVSVDLPSGGFGGGYGEERKRQYQRFARLGQRLHLLQGDSHSHATFERVKGAIGDQHLDYLFIDGDHRYEGVKRDFEIYGPLVRRGGLIAFHDIVDAPPEKVGEVPRFWREIRSRYRYLEIVKDPSQGGFGIGILYVE